jgi:hypothetical protein
MRSIGIDAWLRDFVILTKSTRLIVKWISEIVGEVRMIPSRTERDELRGAAVTTEHQGVIVPEVRFDASILSDTASVFFTVLKGYTHGTHDTTLRIIEIVERSTRREKSKIVTMKRRSR